MNLLTGSSACILPNFLRSAVTSQPAFLDRANSPSVGKIRTQKTNLAWFWSLRNYIWKTSEF